MHERESCPSYIAWSQEWGEHNTFPSQAHFTLHFSRLFLWTRFSPEIESSGGSKRNFLVGVSQAFPSSLSSWVAGWSSASGRTVVVLPYSAVM